MSDLDQLLDVTLDDLADMPEFKVLPPGNHKVNVSFDLKKVNDKQAIELNLKLIETIEKANETDEDCEPGTECNMLFFLDSEFAQGKLKAITGTFRESMGVASLRDLIENVKQIECNILSSIRTDKNDKDKKYLDIKEMQVA